MIESLLLLVVPTPPLDPFDLIEGVGDGDGCRTGGQPHCTDGAGTLLLFIARQELECLKLNPCLQTIQTHSLN